MSLTPQRQQLVVQPDGVLHGLRQSLAGSGHSLSAPIECGGRQWVFCKCGWLFSAGSIAELPERCDVERILFDAEQALWVSDRIADRERGELQRLLRRPSAA